MYYVTIVHKETQSVDIVEVEKKQDISNLLMHVDDQYEVLKVEKVTMTIEKDYKQYCKKNINLETGLKEE